ncbi:unnamed protein product [Vicia faba]|uniref:Uncharacterized protein n=1 Tax=Vicia faba TaxID=3906 RepID=A0AAV1B3G3_VICFA|nr:unnamed protein product [Vicia faba]
MIAQREANVSGRSGAVEGHDGSERCSAVKMDLQISVDAAKGKLTARPPPLTGRTTASDRTATPAPANHHRSSPFPTGLLASLRSDWTDLSPISLRSRSNRSDLHLSSLSSTGQPLRCTAPPQVPTTSYSRTALPPPPTSRISPSRTSLARSSTKEGHPLAFFFNSQGLNLASSFFF